MTGTLVDTNVLVDILNEDPTWFEWSAKALRDAFAAGDVGVNQIILAELAPNYDSSSQLAAAISEAGLERWSLPWEASYVAGKAFEVYRQRGGAKRSPLPDFYIGAHAQVSGLTLVTRDAQRYRSYFPGLVTIAPV